MNRYDISKFIDKSMDMHYFEFKKYLKDEFKHADNIYVKTKIKDKDREIEIRNYWKYLGDFMYFINTDFNNVPAGIGMDGLKVFLPLLESFVQKKQLNKNVLKVFG